MNKSLVIQETRKYVRQKMTGEGTGHDWFHVERVVIMAKRIARKEKGADLFIVEIAALLHDIADWKFHGDETIGAKVSRVWLSSLSVNEEIIEHVCEIVQHISFKGGVNKVKLQTKEGQIVQDSDRLDALGAIGIGRTFAYGGFKGREMYNPDIKPKTFSTLEEYKNAKNTTINHFYEKLLLLKDRMNTKTAKKIAAKRELFMKKFLKEFYKEWGGK
jgi:uncharacterized protein